MEESRKSEQKREITVNIPVNFNFDTNPSTVTLNIEEPNYEGQDYAECLCLSESPKKTKKSFEKHSTPD